MARASMPAPAARETWVALHACMHVLLVFPTVCGGPCGAAHAAMGSCG